MRGRSLNHRMERVVWGYDFNEVKAIGDANVTVTTDGTPVTASALVAGANGLFNVGTDDVDSTQAEIAGPVEFRGSANPIFVCRAKVSTLTGGWVMGLSDAVTDTSLAITQDGGTFASAASTFVGVIFDSDASGTDQFRHVSVNGDADGTLTDFVPSLIPTADKFVALKIVLRPSATSDRSDADIYFDVGTSDKFLPITYRTTITAAVDDDTLLTPYIGVDARTTTSVLLTVDYMFVEHTRDEA